MTSRRLGGYAVVLGLIGALVAGFAYAQEEKFLATVTIVDIKPFEVPDFTINGERFYDAIRQGQKVKLHFRDLKEIRFLTPAKSFQVEVLYNDGRKETVLLQPAADILIDTGGMLSQYSHSKIARIQFAPLPAQPPLPPARPASPQKQPDATPATADRVILRNGDRLSGQVQTKVFPLRTAYGTFRLDAAQIASVEFDATRPPLATVLLRNGDRLSGAVEVESLQFTPTSGAAVSLDSKLIQSVLFKK